MILPNIFFLFWTSKIREEIEKLDNLNVDKKEAILLTTQPYRLTKGGLISESFYFASYLQIKGAKSQPWALSI